MAQLVFLDTEATGVDPDDRLIQVAYRHHDGEQATVVNELFKAPVPIKLPAMAVHHITEKMLTGKPVFKHSFVHQRLLEIAAHPETVLVAHNAKYDLGMLAKEGVEFPIHICTYKVARHIDDGRFQNHQLQYLRYWYGLEIEAVAHDALGDIDVLEAVFACLLEDVMKSSGMTEEQAIDWMIDVSKKPILFTKFNFGKHDFKKTGMTIHDICTKLPYNDGKGYLMWLLAQKMQNPEGEEDWIYTLNYYLKNT